MPILNRRSESLHVRSGHLGRQLRRSLGNQRMGLVHDLTRRMPDRPARWSSPARCGPGTCCHARSRFPARRSRHGTPIRAVCRRPGLVFGTERIGGTKAHLVHCLLQMATEFFRLAQGTQATERAFAVRCRRVDQHSSHRLPIVRDFGSKSAPRSRPSCSRIRWTSWRMTAWAKECSRMNRSPG